MLGARTSLRCTFGRAILPNGVSAISLSATADRKTVRVMAWTCRAVFGASLRDVDVTNARA